MTIINETSAYNIINTTGGETVLDFTFPIFDEDYIKVQYEDNAGVQTDLVIGTDYTVSGVGQQSGGAINLVVGASVGKYYLIQDTPYQRVTDFQEAGDFFARDLNEELDLQEQQIQQLNREIYRSIRVGYGQDTTQFANEVNRIYNSIDNVDTCANDIANINTCASNITDIQNASANAQIATTKASEASASADSASTSATNANNAMTSAQNSATSAEQYAQDAKGFAPIGSLLPLNCTADYVPDGCLPCDGSEYSSTQFPTLWTNYLTSSPVKLQTCTYAEYATSISTYGFCDKFAIDTIALTFKVPTRPNKAYIGVNSTAPVIGNGMTLGLIDGNTGGNYGIFGANTGGAMYVATDIYGANIGTVSYSGNNAGNKAVGVDTDPTKSGLIADTSNLIKESTDIRWFVVVANAQINQSQMDWSAWASSLAGKANTDLSNITATGKETVVGWGMPDYSAGVSISSGYVASRNSAIAGYMRGGSGYASLKVNGVNVTSSIGGGVIQDDCPTFILVSKGDIITWTLTGGASVSLSSYPLKGVN